jgi:hypothetical protein
MRCVGLILMAGLTCITSRILEAQEAPGLEPGAKVRISYRELGRLRVQVGQWNRLDAESVHVTLKSEPRTYSRREIERIEVPAGRKSAFWTGVLYGALPGALFGALAAAGEADAFFTSGELAAFGAVFGFAVGGLTGGLIGAGVGKTRWQQVKLDPDDAPAVSPMIRAVGGQMGIGVRLMLPLRR